MPVAAARRISDSVQSSNVADLRGVVGGFCRSWRLASIRAALSMLKV